MWEEQNKSFTPFSNPFRKCCIFLIAYRNNFGFHRFALMIYVALVQIFFKSREKPYYSTSSSLCAVSSWATYKYSLRGSYYKYDYLVCLYPSQTSLIIPKPRESLKRLAFIFRQYFFMQATYSWLRCGEKKYAFNNNHI